MEEQHVRKLIKTDDLGSGASLFAGVFSFLQPNREHVLAMEELCSATEA